MISKNEAKITKTSLIILVKLKLTLRNQPDKELNFIAFIINGLYSIGHIRKRFFQKIFA